MKRYLGAREQLLGFRKVAVPSPVAPAPRHPISTVPASERQPHLSMVPGRKAEQPPAPAGLGALVKSRRWLRPLLPATPPLGEKTL
jgi:hypothetical protein